MKRIAITLMVEVPDNFDPYNELEIETKPVVCAWDCPNCGVSSPELQVGNGLYLMGTRVPEGKENIDIPLRLARFQVHPDPTTVFEDAETVLYEAIKGRRKRAIWSAERR